MRFLLVNNHCISDPTAGVTQSLRTILAWLAGAGHDCRVVTTARFEAPVLFTIEQHLAERGVPAERLAAPKRRSTRPGAARRTVVDYAVRDVPVRLLMTKHNDEGRPDRAEAAQFLGLVDEALDAWAPDQVIACNAHPMILESMARARARGITTAFAVRGYGYDESRYFTDVDHVFTCSQFLTDHYRARVGLASTPLEPPIDWTTVEAPAETRSFVTFVNPSPHKGLWLFARLADMLGARRPDIPVLVVQSGHSGGALNAIPGVDFGRYPQIMAAPPVPTPAEYFALTRLLVVPSVWDEPFGRVAAEAMINGVPPLVSERGALPGVVGGDYAAGGSGFVLPIPAWLTFRTTQLPTEAEVEPWYDAVCRLWDDPVLYDDVAARGRRRAADRYSEAVSRRAHVDYFTSLQSGCDPLAAGAERA